MAAIGAGHDSVHPGEKERKTFGSHAHCCCNDRECEGVGNISHCVYIKLYCNRGTICDWLSDQIHHFSLINPQFLTLLKDLFTQIMKRKMFLRVESVSSEVCGLSRITRGFVSVTARHMALRMPASACL